MSRPFREHWATKIGFILAVVGSAIGLGNIWKFPYITGENGGSAFIIVYLICIAFVGFPLVLAEFVLGRNSQKDAYGTYKKLKGGGWKGAGVLNIVSAFFIASFYSVVAGWTLAYIYKALKGVFYNFNNPQIAKVYFESYVANPFLPILFNAIFIGMAMWIIMHGIKKGLEKWNEILMPTLFIIIIILVIRGVTLPGSGEGLKFLLQPDFSKINLDSVLIALGHAFFSLSVGMGALITYSSYLGKDNNLIKSSIAVVVLDTLIALLAGVAIFTAVFAYGLNPSGGPGLTFQVLPVVFAKMPAGILFGTLFFVLLSIAALTSEISILETIVAYFMDEKGWSRHKSTIITSLTVFLVSIPCALSFGPLAKIKIFGKTFFGNLDNIASNYMLPIGGLLIAIFIAWSWGTKNAKEEISMGSKSIALVNIWAFLIKYIVPIAVSAILIAKIMGKTL